ncbi:unnamed protein product [Eretmochelys imbricata]
MVEIFHLDDSSSHFHCEEIAKGSLWPSAAVVLVSDENGNTDAFPVAYWTPGPTASR